MTETKPSRGLGSILPFVLVLFAITDIGLRLLPARVLAFRSWEALSRYPAPGAPLEANGYFASSRTRGDMVNLLGMAWLRPHPVRLRSEEFKTDRFGFRNLESDIVRGPITVIATGSSFTVSLGGSDQSTFPAQIAALADRGVYNAGGMVPATRVIDSTMSRFGMTSGTVVHELLEVNEPPPPDVLNRSIPCDTTSGPSARAICQFEQRIDQFVAFSPLSALLLRLHWTVSPGAAIYRLQNGDTIILRPSLLTTSSAPRPTTTAVQRLRLMADECRDRHLRFILVLVPNKETIYGPLLEKPSMSTTKADDYLERLERDVRASGIEVVNTAPLLRAFATAHLSDREYVYYFDDTHWNACGIAIAARAVTAVLNEGAAGPPPMTSSLCAIPD